MGWKITGREGPSSAGAIETAITGGIVTSKDTYKVKNTETGEERRVTANNRDEVGEKISRGEFADDKG